MNKLRKLFQMKFSQKELRAGKKIIASIMLPIMIFQMTSMNFLAMELMKANAEEVVAVPAEEEKKEEIKEEKKVEEKVEVKTEIKTEEKKVEEKVEIVETKTAPEVVEEKVETEVVDPKEEVKIVDDKKAEVETKTEIKKEEVKKEEVKKEIGWVVDGVVASMEKVELNKIYKAPQNEKVTVTFTKLPEIAGSLVIKEIKLTTEEKKSLGALGDTAYDITSDMTNGTFEYNLTLPYPDKDNDGKAEILGDSKKEVKAENLTVLYTEGDELKQKEMKDVKSDKADGVEKQTNKTGKVLEIKGLDHFTIFVVTAPPVMTDPVCSAYPAVFSCVTSLQTAIESSIVGGTIMVSGGTYDEATVTVNKNLTFEISDNVVINGNFIINSGSTLTFEGHGKTVEATGAFTNSGMISSMTSTSGNVVLQSGGNFTVGDISAIANISITSTSGNILDDGVQTTTIDAGGAITLSAGAGNIGAVVSPVTAVSNFNNAIDVEAGTGNVQASALGNISVTEASSANVNLSKYILTSNTAGSYVALGNLTVAGNLAINDTMDSDAKIALMALGNIIDSLAYTNSSDEVGIYAKGNVTLNDLLTVSGASGTAIIKAGFDGGTGSILDDGDQTTTITAKNITLDANGGTVSSVTSGAGGVIDFFGAIDVALGGGTLTTNGGYVTETGGARNGTYTLNGGNLSISKNFASGNKDMLSANGKLKIQDDNTEVIILIGEYAGAVPSALNIATAFGTYYRVQSTGAVNNVNFELRYTVADRGLLAESKVSNAFYNDGAWNAYASQTVSNADFDIYDGKISFSSSTLGTIVAGADETAPIGYSVNIDQAGINNGNKTALSFTFSGAEVGTTYNYSIDDTNGGTSPVTGIGTISSATQQITGIDVSSLTDGTLTLTVSLTDTFANIGGDVTDTVVKDIVAPTLSTATIVSNNATTTLAKVGDVVTVTIVSSEAVQAPVVTIAEESTTTHAGVDALNWTATYTMQTTDDEGIIPFIINFSDIAGNTGDEVTATTNASSVTFDKTAPTVTLSTGVSNPTNITPFSVTAEFSENVTGFAVGDVVVGNGSVGNFDGAGAVYTFDITPAGDGLVTIDVAGGVANDATGNGNAVASQLSRTFDSTSATISSITSTTANGSYNVGDTINVTVTFSEPVTLAGDGTLDVTLGTTDVTDVIAITAFGPATTAVGTYIVGVGDTSADLDATDIVLNGGTLRDNAGNNVAVALPATTIADGSVIVIDTMVPTLSTATIVSNNATTTLAKVGDVVTVTIVSSEAVQAPVVTIAEESTTTHAGVDALNWTATYTMQTTDDEGPIPFIINFSDIAGNTGTQVTIVTAGSNVTFDKSAPTVNAGADVFTNALPYNAIDATVDASIVGVATYAWAQTAGPGVVSFVDATVEDVDISGVTLQGSYTLQLTVTDLAGNVQTDTMTFVYDTTVPEVYAGTNKTKNALFTQDATTTDPLAGIATYSWTQFSGPGAITFGSTNAEDTTISADTDGTYEIRLTVTDRAGNNNTNAMTLVWDATAPTVDAGANVVMNVLPSALDATVNANVSGVATYLWEQTSGPGAVTFSATNVEDPNVTAISVNGVYILRLTVTDLAGNSASDTLSFTYDNIAPTTTITDPLTGDYKGGAFSIVGTATDGTGTGVASIQVKIQRASDSNYWNGAGWVAGESWNGAVGTDNWNIGFLGLDADTSYAITSIATDSAGNVQSAGLASISVLGDVSEPTSAISAPANGSFLNALGAISGTASDTRSGVVTVEITIQRASGSNYWTGAGWGAETPLATTYGAGNWTKNAGLPAWESGETYTIKSTAWDAVDNSQGTPASSAFTFDNVAPVVAVDALETNDTTPTLTGTVDDATATIEITIGGITHAGTNNGATWSYTWPDALAQGTYDIEVSATDLVSNEGNDGTIDELKVDTTNPSVNAGSDKTENAEFTQDAIVTDNLSGVASFAWTNQTPVVGTITFGTNNEEDTTVSADTEGTYTIRLTVFDEVGNSAFDEFTLVWDATDPTITLNAPNAFINDNTPTLTGNAVDGATTIVLVEYEIDGNGTWLGATASDGTFDELNEDHTFTTASLLDGAHTIKTRATDNAGNIVDAGNYATQSFTLDTVAPTAPAYISSEGGTVWHRVNPLLDIDFADDVKINTVEYKVNAGGVYQTIATGINALTYTTDWSMDNAIWTAMAEGSNYLYFRTTDYAGNQYLTENDTVQTVDIDAAFTIKKDVTAPNAPTYVTVENQWYASNPTFDIDFSDARAIQTVEYQLDGTGGAWTTLAGVLAGTTYTINWNVSLAIWNGLIDGSHDIYFRVTDDAGNTYVTADQSGAFTFKKDITAPGAIANLTNVPVVNTWSTDNTIAFDWDDSVDAGVGLSGYSYIVDHVADTIPDSVVENAISTYTTGALADGSDWYFHVKAIDGVGNATVIVHKGPFKIDTIAPTITHTKVATVNVGVGIEINASVDDHSGSGINEARLYYKINNGVWNDSQMSHTSGDNYQKTLDSRTNPNDTVVYYIKAKDELNNTLYRYDGGSGSSQATAESNAYSVDIISTISKFSITTDTIQTDGTMFGFGIASKDVYDNDIMFTGTAVVTVDGSTDGGATWQDLNEASYVVKVNGIATSNISFNNQTSRSIILQLNGSGGTSFSHIKIHVQKSDNVNIFGNSANISISGFNATVAGIESDGSDGSQVQGDQAPADQGVLDDGVVKDGSPVSFVPWYKSLPFEIIAMLILLGSTIWWWIKKRGVNGGAGGFSSFVFIALKAAASRARMFLW